MHHDLRSVLNENFKSKQIIYTICGLFIFQVFDVALNDIVVVKDLDIFGKVGRGVAHDEVVPFQIRKNKIIIDGKTYPFDGEIRVDFIKVRFFHRALH